MTDTIEIPPTTELIEDTPGGDADQTPTAPKVTDEFVALLAQAYVMMPLFP